MTESEYTTHYDGTRWEVKHLGITICDGTADTEEEALAACWDVIRQATSPDHE